MVVKRGLVGKVTEVKLVHLVKAFRPMVVTESGISIEVKLVQFWKAYPPMVVTESGIVIEVKPEAP